MLPLRVSDLQLKRAVLCCYATYAALHARAFVYWRIYNLL
jgi:hypothetical protein